MSLSALPDLRLPPGYVARPVRGVGDIEARVRSHAVAWSEFGPSSHRLLAERLGTATAALDVQP
jgi:hypothetical protein